MQTTTKYETGATSHAVNDLILFTENTRLLAEKRDWLYRHCMDCNIQNKPITGHLSDEYKAKADKEYLQGQFKYLLYDTIRLYNKELGDTYSFHALTIKQRNEFARIYANDYTTWKTENGYQ